MFVLSLLLILPLIVSTNALAVDEAVEEGVLLTRAVILVNRTQIVLNTLELNKEQVDAFSPVYLDYWEEMNLINDKLADLILDYSDNFENLTDEKALSMLDGYLDVQKKKIALKKKYVKKFKKVLTPKKLVQYYQTENKLDAIIMMELAAGVPLVK
jgi:DNA polymerase IIIc chi subunit